MGGPFQYKCERSIGGREGGSIQASSREFATVFPSHHSTLEADKAIKEFYSSPGVLAICSTALKCSKLKQGLGLGLIHSLFSFKVTSPIICCLRQLSLLRLGCGISRKPKILEKGKKKQAQTQTKE